MSEPQLIHSSSDFSEMKSKPTSGANGRRAIFIALVFSTMVALGALMLLTLSAEGIDPIEWALFACFAITLPWTVIGFWNAVIGFALMRLSKRPAAAVFPALGNVDMARESTSKVALNMCIRNEDVATVLRNVETMMNGLAKAGRADAFDVFLLSDSTEPEIVAQEELSFTLLRQRWAGRMNVTYRLREDNYAFKAGNIRDFCERWGANYDYMLVLDADSVMAPNAIDRLVKVLDQNPKVGLVQSLVVGLPATSAFTRIFQFGMRLGMRSYTLGSAWWQSDCGPYWGHNALIRLKPFIEDCHLPEIPGKGPLRGTILSHDQVEAVLMRRAGYECRVVAEEGGSWEENPPDLVEFIRRDLRWCHGNMQYIHLLNMPGLKFTSRIQLLLAILMFVGSPAWIGFILLATINLLSYDMVFEGFDAGPGIALFATIMSMIFAPKLATIADVLLSKKRRRSFGGGLRFIFGAFAEIVFSMLIAPIMAIATTVFLAKLPFGKAKAWAAQRRGTANLPLGLFVQRLWPQTLFGIAGLTALIVSNSVTPMGLVVSLPVFFGPLIAILLGWSTSSPALGNLTTRLKFWTLPDETIPEPTVAALDLEAVSVKADEVLVGDSGSDKIDSPLKSPEKAAA